ncbi:ATPase, AAA family [Labilithrix luteola]|uniref:Replication-associated recombination protein A n=1 Tax=Labilithrix luteola TaxID=1391654 RepID=A0A0K1PT55_9BACT|nr:replication-associated recombination protein A [Labilithrix luteola]AKU96710.1 ATPase, AAA family [Labilithrix luteola]
MFRTGGDTLFGAAAKREAASSGAVPLAERMRPTNLGEYVGQKHVLGPGKLLLNAIEKDRVPSMILWGPPGVGKTTLGRVIAERTRSVFVPFSAVLGSIQELREIVAAARERLSYKGERTLVFVDEIHRFNKAQQDAFLPHVEAGTITLVGATTENPSFAVNAALLSRCKVFRLEALTEEALVTILERAIADNEHGIGGLSVDPEAVRTIARMARGDGRRSLAILEAAAEYARSRDENAITTETLAASEEKAPLLYDKAGEEHYNVVSAFIKSMRGSDPDAAVYWMMRMLEAGDDPLFVLRRMLIFASEDVGMADPRALVVVSNADAAFRRMGLPEGLYPLTHAAVYLACAPKSNAVKNAWHRAKALIEERGALPVPMKLRNAVTTLMKQEGYGTGYKYAHDYDDGVVPGETYLPDELVGTSLYEPTEHGEEARIRARLAALRARRSENES